MDRSWCGYVNRGWTGLPYMDFLLEILITGWSLVLDAPSQYGLLSILRRES